MNEIVLKTLKPNFVCDKVINDINSLLKQLSFRNPKQAQQYSKESLKRLLSNPLLVILIAIDVEAKKIVGVASIHFLYMLSEKAANIGDVVVDESYRGKKIGETLVQKLIEIGKEKEFVHIDGKINKISLTSHPSREAANALYVKLGFTKADTNLYRLHLNNNN